MRFARNSKPEIIIIFISLFSHGLTGEHVFPSPV